MAHRKKSHPWLTDACRNAIDAKNVSIDTPSFDQKQRDCVEKLRIAHREYIVELKKKIAALSRSDKRWWSLNRELLQKKAKTSSIPPLKSADGQWLRSELDKANELATSS